MASNNTISTGYDKKELIIEYNRARAYAAHVGNLGPLLIRHYGPGELALVRNKASGHFENGYKDQFIVELKEQGMMLLVDSEGRITSEDANDVITLCSAWTVDRPNESAHKLSMCRPKNRNAAMQNIILQAIIDGKRRGKANGKVDLDFTAIGGCELTIEEEWHRRGRVAKKEAVLQSQDDSVRSTIMTRGRAAKGEEEKRKKRERRNVHIIK